MANPFAKDYEDFQAQTAPSTEGVAPSMETDEDMSFEGPEEEVSFEGPEQPGFLEKAGNVISAAGTLFGESPDILMPMNAPQAAEEARAFAKEDTFQGPEEELSPKDYILQQAEGDPTTLGDVVSGARTIGAGIVEGLQDVGHGAISLGLSGISAGTEKATGYNPGLAEWFQEKVPPSPQLLEEEQPEGGLANITREVSGTVAGGAGAGRVIGKTVQALKDLPKAIQFAAKALGFNVGSGLGRTAQEGGSENLLIGEGASLGSLSPDQLQFGASLGVNPEGSYDENLFRAKVDKVTDAVAQGVLGSVAVAPAAWLGRIVKGVTWDPLVEFVNPSARQKVFFDDLAKRYADINPNDLPDVQKAKLDGLANTIRSNLDLILEPQDLQALSKELGVPVDQLMRKSTAPGIVEGIPEGSVRQAAGIASPIRRTTPEALFAGAVKESPAEDLLAAEARADAASFRGKSSKFRTAESRNVERLGTTEEEMRGALGGERLPDSDIRVGEKQSVESIQRRGQEEVGGFEAQATQAEKNVAEAQEAYRNRLREDPVIGERISKVINEGIDLQQLTSKEGYAREIRDKILQVRDSRLEEMRALSEKIPAGIAPKNSGAIITKIEELKKAGMISEKLANELLSSRSAIAGGAQGLDFKEVYKHMGELSSEVSRAANTVDAFNGLRDLRSMINESIPDVPEAQALRDYYQKSWGEFNDGAIERISDLTRKTVDRGGKGAVTHAAETRKMVEGAVGDAEYAQHIKTILDSPEGGNSGKLVADMVTNDVVDRVLEVATNSRDLLDVRSGDLFRPLSQAADALKTVDPESAKQLTNLVNDLSSGKLDISRLEEISKTTRTAADEARKRIMDVELKPYFDNLGTRESPSAIMADLLKKDNVNIVKGVIEQARKAGDQQAIKGMQSSYLREWKKNIESTALTGGTEKDVNLAKLSRFEEGQPIYDVGKEIFKDRPNSFNLIDQLTQDTRLKTAAKAAPASGDRTDKAGRLEKAQRAWNILVTWTLGVLNPTATRARSLGTAGLKQMDTQDQLFRFAETIMSDAGEFEKELTKYMSRKFDGTIPADLKAMMLKAARRSGVRIAADRQFADNEENPEGFEE